MRASLPPGPREPSALQLGRWVVEPVQFLERCRRRFGDVFTIRWTGLGDIVVVAAPDLLRQVFTADADVLLAGEANEILEPMLGKHSVLVLDGIEHLRQRRMLLPAFHGERMKEYATVMRACTEAAFAKWPVHQPFALHPTMQAITLDVIIRTVFGIEDAAAHDRLRDELVRLLDITTNPLLMLFALFGLDPFELAPWSQRTKLKRAIDAMIFAEIARRRRSPRRGTDVLSMMLEARDEAGQGMTDLEIRDELMTLLLAGHETTATSLAWTFEQLLGNPAALARLRDELAAAREEYLDAVIKEALRLRPIIPMVARYVQRPFTLGAWTVPPGARIAPCIYLANRRPEAYPEPDRFLPERWLGTRPDPYEWLPFGGGARRCLGMAFALFEMRIVLETIVPRVDLRFANGPSRVVRRAITLAPSGGVRVVVDRWNKSPAYDRA